MTLRSVRSQPSLPAFVSPMLAQKGQPFDSEEHLFEIKWDGTRMLAFVDGDGSRLVNRHRAERTLQYPELACLGELPAGVILDGEVVVLHEGRPDFGRLLSRDQAGSALKIRLSARSMPATYMVFDLLYEAYESLLDRPLFERRRRLRQLLVDLDHPQVVFSEGIVGAGRVLFEEVCRQGLEGVVAKRLSSRYRPGKRTTAWLKIKPRLR